MNDYLLDAFWSAVRDRLDTNAPAVAGGTPMQTILGGAGRVYVTGLDRIPASGGAEGAAWKRLVIVPTLTLWDEVEVAGETTNLAFLVRVEANDLIATGYQPARGVGLAQREAYRLLAGWLPEGLDDVLVALPLRRHRAPQPVPLRDPDRTSVLFTSAEYRTEVAGVPAGA
ncbi:MAG TPA: hypothetical protein VEB59_02455 [Gemmatimonadales bacterium]|nr:hypothetical protein [Gemmatimonadales bacterium]